MTASSGRWPARQPPVPRSPDSRRRVPGDSRSGAFPIALVGGRGAAVPVEPSPARCTTRDLPRTDRRRRRWGPTAHRAVADLPAVQGRSRLGRGDTLTIELPTARPVAVWIDDLPRLLLLAEPLEREPESLGDVVLATDLGADPSGRRLRPLRSRQRSTGSATAIGVAPWLFPAVRFLTGTLQLRSGVHLRLEPGALLQGSDDPRDYPIDAGRVESARDEGSAARPAISRAHDDVLAAAADRSGGGRSDIAATARSTAPGPSCGRAMARCPICSGSARVVTWTSRVCCSAMRPRGHCTCWPLATSGSTTWPLSTTGRTSTPMGSTPTCHRTCPSIAASSTPRTTPSASRRRGTPTFRVTPRASLVRHCLVSSRDAALKLGTESEAESFREVRFEDCAVYESGRAMSVVVRDGARYEDVSFRGIEIGPRVDHLVEQVIGVARSGGQLGSIRDLTFEDVRAPEYVAPDSNWTWYAQFRPEPAARRRIGAGLRRCGRGARGRWADRARGRRPGPAIGRRRNGRACRRRHDRRTRPQRHGSSSATVDPCQRRSTTSSLRSPIPMPQRPSSNRRLGCGQRGGGRHDAHGTYNRLIWLGDSYVELMGVFDEALADASWWGRHVRSILAQTSGGFAGVPLAANDLAHEIERLRERGSTLLDPVAGERARPDGQVVRWSIGRLPSPDPDLGLVFLIEHDRVAPSGDRRIGRHGRRKRIHWVARLASFDSRSRSAIQHAPRCGCCASSGCNSGRRWPAVAPATPPSGISHCGWCRIAVTTCLHRPSRSAVAVSCMRRLSSVVAGSFGPRRESENRTLSAPAPPIDSQRAQWGARESR